MQLSILATASSCTQDGNSETLLKTFIEGIKEEAKKRDIKLNLTYIRLYDLSLPYFTNECKVPKKSKKEEQDLIRIGELIKQADGWVIASPVWNFTYPAILKNLIDRIGYVALDYSNNRTRPAMQRTRMAYLMTCGAPWWAWWALLRWTSGFSLQMAFSYFGASYGGMTHAHRCTPRRHVKDRAKLLKRVKRRGQAYLRKTARHAKRQAKT